MYIFDDMIELGFPTGTKPEWPSPAHRRVAETALLCNPRIRFRDQLIQGVAIINKIPVDQIKKVTVADLRRFGVTV